jgi:hypothetical protein
MQLYLIILHIANVYTRVYCVIYTRHAYCSSIRLYYLFSDAAANRGSITLHIYTPSPYMATACTVYSLL